jgi:hypothetical protein
MLNLVQLYDPDHPMVIDPAPSDGSPPLKADLARSLDLSPYQTALSVVLGVHD